MTTDQIRILLIEDNPSDQRLIEEMFRQVQDLACHLELCNLLAEGMKRLEQKDIDVVLLDLSLPDSTGLETLVQVYEHFPEVPIIVLTGFDDAQTGLQAVQSGAQDYLIKDEVNSSLLIRSARYAIERHRIEKTLRKREEEYRSLIDDVFDNAAEAVFILDKDCKIVWLNEAAENYFGVARENVLGQDKREFIRQHMSQVIENPDLFAETLLRAYENNTYIDSLIYHLVDGKSGKVQERWVEHSSKPIRAGLYAGGRIEQYMDITEPVRTEMAEREQRTLAEALSDSAVALTSTLDLDEVLDRILENVRYVVPHDTAKILLIDDKIARVVRVSGHNNHDPVDVRLGVKLNIEEETYLRYMYDTGNPIAIHDIQIDSDWAYLPGDERLHACVSAPIRLQAETIGFINLLSEEIGTLKSNHAERLQLFSAQAAIAIQNARLYEQSRELVAVEERQRLARDLHDAVSQSLFSASVIAQSIPRLWQKNPEKVLPQLHYLDDLTQSALTEMRMLLMELRPEALRDVPLGELMNRLAAALKTRKQIAITTTFDAMPEVPLDLKIALYRIAQEALNNVSKHSQATEAHLSLTYKEDNLTLEIQDNGMGFEKEDTGLTHYGLNIMRERAEEIGGELLIESYPNKGTCVMVKLSTDTVSSRSEMVD